MAITPKKFCDDIHSLAQTGVASTCKDAISG
jgi:hypothetical protein